MRDLITSTANPHVKSIRSLVRFRKERSRERMFVVEGVRLVEEALAQTQPATLLYVADQLNATARGRALLDQFEQAAFAYPTTPQVLAELSDVETPQGVIAIVPQPEAPKIQAEFILILDGVQDPGNVGTLLRSAEAAGVDLVIALRGSADVWSPKVVRSAMGAHFRLPLLADVLFDDVLPTIKDVNCYAAVQTAPLDYDRADWLNPCAVVIGNEANGVTAETLQHCQPLTIPMHGSVESLNAAVAGSVILFEAARQRRR